MSYLKKIIVNFIVLVVLFSTIKSVLAVKSRYGPLRSFGDYIQIINPVLTADFASQKKDFGYFSLIYGQTFVTVHAMKFIATKNKWRPSKRPSIEGKKNRYDSMPSGHTTSAWVAASYLRTFSDDYKYWSIPLYATAIVTGYSRIHAKEHTLAQVISGAALAEFVTFINSKLDWRNEYRSSNFYFSRNELIASFEFRF